MAQRITRPLQGSTLQARIRDLIAQTGLTIQALADMGGVNWPAAKNWTKDGGDGPEPKQLQALARGLAEYGVTPEQLLGAAAGQEPSFEAWQQFKLTPEGQSASAIELRMLAGFPWLDRPPTVLAYQMLLMAVRAAEPPTGT